jgi:hypothetical protein
LIRVTIKDKKQTISFITEKDTLLRLVAGCSINPSDIGDLLIATDIYQRGLVAEVMVGLMEFDKAIQSQGPKYIHQVIAQARELSQPIEIGFQVIDDLTAEEAFQPRAGDLVIIDLMAHRILASQNLEIPASGEVHIHSGEAETNRRVSYILPQDWTIEAI